ncbi:MAG: hypothetical protein P4M05_23955 [Bradyrhizobium sp.]|nr:hypothetical protein [Bradyrhizobium sp.]
MDQKTVVQEAIVDAVTAAINLMRSLGLIPLSSGGLMDRPQRLIQDSVLTSLPLETLNQEVAGSGLCADICRIYVYIFGCKGCAKLGRRLNTKIYKIGSTIEHNLETRLEQIGKDRYGAWINRGNEIEIEEGFSDWIALPITTSRPSANPVVTLMPRTIQIDLPRTMTRRVFDASLQEVLSPRALHLQKNATPKRLTQYGMGGASRLSKAHELYEFSPTSKNDGDMLLKGIEAVLEKHRRDRI